MTEKNIERHKSQKIQAIGGHKKQDVDIDNAKPQRHFAYSNVERKTEKKEKVASETCLRKQI